MVSEANSHCLACDAPISAKTLEKYDGVCRRCHKQPLALRKQWIVFGALAILALLAALLIDQELAALEASGGTKRVNVLVAICYRLGGRFGVAVFFTVFGVAVAGFAYRSFQNARMAKVRNSTIDAIER